MAISDQMKGRAENVSPFRLLTTELQLIGTLRTRSLEQKFMQNSWLAESRIPRRLAMYSLMMQVSCPASLCRNVYMLQGGQAQEYTISRPFPTSFLISGPAIPKIGASMKLILALSEMSILSPLPSDHYCIFKLINVTDSNSGSRGRRLFIKAAFTEGPPISMSAFNHQENPPSSESICSQKPTAMKITKATESAQIIEVLLLDMRWQERFLIVREQSVWSVQKRSTLAMNSSSRYSKLQESMTSPTNSPCRKRKKRVIISPRFMLIIALGSKQYTARPQQVAMMPKVTFPQGNYCPSTQISVLTYAQLALPWPRLSLRVSSISPLIGERDAMMGTRNPINNAERQAYRVNPTSISRPISAVVVVCNDLNVRQAEGYAIKLAKKTCLIAPPKTWQTTCSLLPPITFKTLISAFCLSSPARRVASSMRTLSKNKEATMDLSITPINMPRYCRDCSSASIGISTPTAKKPISRAILCPQFWIFLTTSQVSALLQTPIRLGRFMVASVAISAKENVGSSMSRANTDQGKVCLTICWTAEFMSKNKHPSAWFCPILPFATSNTSFTMKAHCGIMLLTSDFILARVFFLLAYDVVLAANQRIRAHVWLSSSRSLTSSPSATSNDLWANTKRCPFGSPTPILPNPFYFSSQKSMSHPTAFLPSPTPRPI